jgi:hypothetical protein
MIVHFPLHALQTGTVNVTVNMTVNVVVTLEIDDRKTLPIFASNSLYNK